MTCSPRLCTGRLLLYRVQDIKICYLAASLPNELARCDVHDEWEPNSRAPRPLPSRPHGQPGEHHRHGARDWSPFCYTNHAQHGYFAHGLYEGNQILDCPNNKAYASSVP